MPDGNPRARRLPATSIRRRSRRPNPSQSPHPRTSAAKPRKSVRILRRYSSEPVLLTVRFLSSDDGGSTVGTVGDGGSCGIGDSLFLPRYHTFTDVFSPSLSLLKSPSPSARHLLEDEAKVVVSVTVEGSPGPVRAMLRLGSSVKEAIGVVVDRYGREGRSPRLDPEAAASFQLHHSHFSLQSLNKSDKIGEVGGRSFYLRKTCGDSNINIGSEGSDTTGCSEVELLNHRPLVPHLFFFSFFTRRFSKIGRRTRKLWKMVACIACS